GDHKLQNTVNNELEKARLINRDLQKKHELAVSYLAKTKRAEIESKEILEELTKRLQLSEELLVTKVDLLTKLRKEIKKTEEIILTLEETLRTNVKKMKIEVEKFINKLETEEQDRLFVQHRLDEILADLIDTKISIELFLKEMSIYMNKMKRRRNELAERGRVLQVEIVAYTEKNELLKQQVTLEDTLLKKTEDSLSTAIDRLKREYMNVKISLQNANEELIIHHPKLVDIENKHTLAKQLSDGNKLDAADKESEANSLLSTIRDLNKKIVILEKTKPELKTKLTESRNTQIWEMGNNSLLTRQVEGELYEIGRKLEFFTIENCRLKNCIEKELNSIQSLKKEGSNQRAEMNKQKEAVNHIFENLINTWAGDTSIEEEYSESDHSTLNSIKDLILKIQYRERTVGRINEGLQEHLSRIVAFVESAESSEISKQKCLLK
uniref:Uncharacterized protein n=1 Tax=Callorhinchus milii TaxID=7868 RepID=A0A4W3GHL8_CALMI